MIKAFTKSHVGNVRTNNEDCTYASVEEGIFIICDGVGGQNAGEVASAMATSLIVFYLEEYEEKLASFVTKESGDEDALKHFGAEAVRYACHKIHEKSLTKAGYSKMCTTLTMLLVVGGRALICHVGDSRLYLVRNEKSYQITEDHTLAKLFYVQGLIDDVKDASRQVQNTLTRSLGAYDLVDVDCLVIDLQPASRFILMTDGISDYLNNNILSLVSEKSCELAANDLINFALLKGGKDNASCIIVDVDVEESEDVQDEEVIGRMRTVDYFSTLSYLQLVRLKNSGELLELEGDDVLFEKNVETKGFYILISGHLSIDRKVVSKYSSPLSGLVGAFEVRDDCRAVTHAIVFYLSHESFADLMYKYPRTANRILFRALKICSQSN